MADITRRYLVSSFGTVGAGLALSGLFTGAATSTFRRSPSRRVQDLPLETVRVNCGFKERTPGDPAQLAYGNSVRDWLYQEVSNAVGSSGFQDQAARFDVAADVLENLAAAIDPDLIGEIWLHVTGSVGGRYRSREYVVEL